MREAAVALLLAALISVAIPFLGATVMLIILGEVVVLGAVLGAVLVWAMRRAR